MTQHFLVFIVWPALVSPLRLALTLSTAGALSWRPEKGAMFYVIDKRRGGPGHVATYRWAGGCFIMAGGLEQSQWTGSSTAHPRQLLELADSSSPAHSRAATCLPPHPPRSYPIPSPAVLCIVAAGAPWQHVAGPAKLRARLASSSPSPWPLAVPSGLA